jgi:DNA polymerase-3 subunit alpha
MGKKQIDKMTQLEALFYEGGQKNGYDKKVLNKIWEDWKKFASYAFNKSHATCYSWVAYQTAYLKANYPSEYMAAVLSSNLNDITTLSKYMDECRSMGIEVLGPNINESYKSFSATKDGRIRFGLAGIKGVGAGCVDAIVEERNKNGNYKDIFDFVQRINQGACNRKALESMALAGAFDDFKDIKREDFFEVNPRGEAYSETLMRFGQKYQISQQEMQNSLFGAFGAIEVATPPIPNAEPWSQLERLNRERELVGMYLSAHPLDPYFIEVNYGCDTPLAEVKSKSGQLDKELTMGGLVVDFQMRMGKKGNQFGIMKIEDYSGSFEFMLFGNKFVDYQKYGVPGYAIVVRGAYEKGYGDNVRFNVRSIDLLENLKGKMVKNILISLKDEDLSNVDFLKQYLGVDGENRCDLYFRMKDHVSGNYVMLRSKRPIAASKRLLDSLREAGIKFKVNARV